MANWMIFQVVRNKFSSVHSRRNVCCSLAVLCILQIYLHSMKQPLGPKDMSRFCPFSDSLFRHSFRMSNSYCMFPLTVYCVSHKRWWWLLKLHVRLLRELRENKISRKLVVVVAVLVFHYSTYSLVRENETKQNRNANWWLRWGWYHLRNVCWYTHKLNTDTHIVYYGIRTASVFHLPSSPQSQ